MGPKLLSTKEGLIIAAIEVISERGLQGLTTKEVAKRQGISESTIFKHYKTKNELLLAVLDHFSQFDQAIIESMEDKKHHPIEAIIYFVDSYVTYYANYPQITAIIHTYEGFLREPQLSKRIKEIFNNRLSTMQLLIEEAKAHREFKADLDSEHLAGIIIGLERLISLKWRINNYNFSLRDHTLSALKMQLDLLSKE
ncbi:TetR/AcrR family transcriptional regulator [Desulfosporosinus youngiae]|uniref:Transcriptional regulator n=1 Tax=Desulfosporosinus youngiae DSM 17734 TaxID=768710 RepID=H5XSY4_9FIRM|nr:TetR/AcrR family transcriptional regulator [Desulfosporosinus youngiae]EHQ87947.1 transcriptional regulator [Desulfosporosinus youngiae DSM 17734]